ncbi:hypothetical protein CUJ89_09795 [Burkholderia pyrrocinia]|uniref:DUF4124 domain-containing protein n=1 Tax=Burkholderia pyrrocinia TaxID=60550 RepID=A0A2Z5MVK5_BURPY|nr:hypothetical protein CUJ89_09795 [Burkholderia pyrrocinia]
MKSRFLPPCLLLAAAALTHPAQAADCTWTDAVGARPVAGGMLPAHGPRALDSISAQAQAAPSPRA